MAANKPKKVCIEAKDCRIVAARLDFKSAKGCAARTAAAEAFRVATYRRTIAAPQALKEKLYKESLRHIAGAHRSCGNEEAAQKAEAAAKAAVSAEEMRSARIAADARKARGLNGVRRRRSRR